MVDSVAAPRRETQSTNVMPEVLPSPMVGERQERKRTVNRMSAQSASA